jgi:hypothetical protein
MMNQKEWLERATEFSLGECIFYNRPVKIVARDQINGEKKWVLKMHEWVLGKDGEFHWEPMPSSRTDKFIDNTRFDTPDECHSFWVDNVNAEKPLYG